MTDKLNYKDNSVETAQFKVHIESWNAALEAVVKLAESKYDLVNSKEIKNLKK